MLATLAAALALAGSMAIDVPYLPQTDALCGGAAVAMVLRYWGEAHADAQEFAALVDRRAGGIANDALTAAVTTRGWRALRVGGSIDALSARIHDGHPVIVLLPERRDRYHYVVVIAAGDAEVVVHDPAWGPSRSIPAPEFERAWRAAGFWSLVILPPAPPSLDPDPGSLRRDWRPLDHRESAAPPVVNGCGTRLDHAIDEIRTRGIDQAEALLNEVRSACPTAPGPIRELSGVRFAQRRWADAAALAREALRRDPRDAYALDLLGSSLFMLDDEMGALRAWNQIGKPRVNRVRIEGLRQTRYQTVSELMAIQPNMLLTAELFERARRRLGELPNHAAARLAVKPEADGFAMVDVVVIERAAAPRGAVEWAGTAARTAVNRQLDVALPGGTGQGEVWSASARWWSGRPAVGFGFAAPRAGRVPGVWRVEASWQSDTYRAAQSPDFVENRTHGAVSVSDWLSGGIRYALSAGADAWTGGRKALAFGGTLEHASFGDRLILSADATQWTPLTGGPAFRSSGAHASARSSIDARGWVARGAAGVERVSDAAPLGLWPGAGEGLVRAPLLRAHPLLDGGVVDLTPSSAFGRSLVFGTLEVQRWLDRPRLVRVGVAAFADLAQAGRSSGASRTPLQTDIGGGVQSGFREHLAHCALTSRTAFVTAPTR